MPIIQSISRFLQTIQLPFLVISKINRQKKFIHNNISPQLSDVKKITDGSLNETDFEKITGYYGLAVPAILGEAFCGLAGKKMTDKERMSSTCQGAMTGLFDDFFDEQRLSDNMLENLIEDPGGFTGSSANEKLFLQFYKAALTSAPRQAIMRNNLYRVFRAQLLSKEQAVPGLSLDILKDITIHKGAESVLFYRTAFGPPLKNREEKMLYCLGGLMQLSNDIFDVYKDHKQGIHTLVTETKKIADLRLYYSSLLQIGIEAAFKTKYAAENIRRFLGIVSIGIFSRCYVCLDQLEKVEKKYGHDFDPNKYERAELICDMDTVVNKWSSFRYHMKLSGKFHS